MVFIKFTLILVLLILVSSTQSSNAGVRVRLTKSGMEYAIKVGIDILEVDLKKEVIHASGGASHFSFSIENTRITDVSVASRDLRPVAGKGIDASVSGMDLKVKGTLHFKYDRKWLPTIRGTINFDAHASGVSFSTLILIGASSDGRPTVAMETCSAHVSGMSVKFHGKFDFIYNAFHHVIEDKLKDEFNKLICKSLNDEVKGQLKNILDTLPVTEPIDSHSQIDYRLTSPPEYTAQYMDVFFKGIFEPVHGKSAPPPSTGFSVGEESERMIYFWVSAATINSAGSVYQKAALLKTYVSAWDPKIPAEVREILNTDKVGVIIPEVEKKYPHSQMAVDIRSYAAPTCTIEKDAFVLKLFAQLTFQARNGTSKEVEPLFIVKADITAEAEAISEKGRISAKINSFDYHTSLVSSNVGPIPDLNNFLIKAAITFGIINKANPILEKGFPLPTVGHFSIINSNVTLEKGAISVGTDVQYKTGWF